jgi:hypothetical protein
MKLSQKIMDWLKRASAFIQGSLTSFDKHNSEYELPGWLETERKRAQQHDRDDDFNNPEFRLRDFLGEHTEVRAVAIDIGSGAGWYSSKLSKVFDRVIALEPSAKVLEMGRTLYPKTQYSNIEWVNGFAERILPTIKLDEPGFFLTSTVFSHLRDKEVSEICREVNRLALPGSLLCFNECWGPEHHQFMWHVRTKEWWKEQLPGWDLDFFGPEIQNVPGRHKSFHGVKVS